MTVRLSHEQFKRIWKGMTEQQQQKAKDKAAWEQMSLWAVLQEWPALIPKPLRLKIKRRRVRP